MRASHKSKYSVLLFDLDGTLVDTEKVAMEVTAKYFYAHNRKISVIDLQYLVGRAWPLAISFLLDRYPLQIPSQKVEQEILDLYQEELKKNVPSIPGSVEAVQNLSKDFRLGVVSGSRRKDIILILKTLGIYTLFENIFGFENYSEPKPSPIPYKKAISTFQVQEEDVLVFEDSPVGVYSAQKARLDVVVISHSHSALQEPPILSLQKPAFFLKDFHAFRLDQIERFFEESNSTARKCSGNSESEINTVARLSRFIE